MDIMGLEKLSGLAQLNRRIYQDGAGWHFEIFNIPGGVSTCSKEAFNRIPEMVVVDLAQENNCTTADEVRQLHDDVMEFFYNDKIKIRSNGIESICPEVDTRELNLKLSSYQIEMLQDGLCSIGERYTDNEWDPEANPEYFALLDMFHITLHDKKHIKELIKERRQESLQSRQRT